MKTAKETGLKPGDIISYKKRQAVVLVKLTTNDIERYHIYGPEIGVYTIFPDEVILIGHTDKLDELIAELNMESYKQKSA